MKVEAEHLDCGIPDSVQTFAAVLYDLSSESDIIDLTCGLNICHKSPSGDIDISTMLQHHTGHKFGLRTNSP